MKLSGHMPSNKLCRPMYWNHIFIDGFHCWTYMIDHYHFSNHIQCTLPNGMDYLFSFPHCWLSTEITEKPKGSSGKPWGASALPAYADTPQQPMRCIPTSQGLSRWFLRPWPTSLSWTLFTWWQNDTLSQSQLLPSLYQRNGQGVDIYEVFGKLPCILGIARDAGRLSANHVSFVTSFLSSEWVGISCTQTRRAQ